MKYILVGITINNFRVFGKETNFKLSPITILIGTNSSGKSSLTKALKLLVRSFNKNGLRKLELMETDLKLGGFNTIINSNSKKKTIEFCLEVKGDTFIPGLSEEKNYRISLIYDSTGLKKYSIHDEIGLLMEQEGDFGNEYKKPIKSFLRVSETILNKSMIVDKFAFLSKGDLQKVYQALYFYLQNKVELHDFKEYNDYNGDLLITEKFDLLTERFKRAISGISNIGIIDKQYRIYEDENGEVEYIDEHIMSDNPKFIDILPKNIIDKVEETVLNEFFTCDYLLNIPKPIELFPKDLFSKIFSNIEFIEGVRATQEILYTSSNNPEFYQLLDDIYNSKDQQFILGLENWLVNKFKILKLVNEESFNDIFKINQISGIGYQIAIYQNGINIGLSGLGYGITQLLPMLLKLIIYYNSGKTFVIEEPESNLHPALQSQLANCFMSYINGSIQDYIDEEGRNVRSSTGFNAKNNGLIIETHSEYLIRKLQFLTAKKDFKTEQTIIYYFNPLDNIPFGEEQIKIININNDGSLSDNFGAGFFDEASSWKFELLKLSNPQLN